MVFLLLVCKLIVATGTLSGLMFYAILLESIVPSFYQWNLLMLDFGIETCFYNEMGAYSKPWLLQFSLIVLYIT